MSNFSDIDELYNYPTDDEQNAASCIDQTMENTQRFEFKDSSILPSNEIKMMSSINNDGNEIKSKAHDFLLQKIASLFMLSKISKSDLDKLIEPKFLNSFSKILVKQYAKIQKSKSMHDNLKPLETDSQSYRNKKNAKNDFNDIILSPKHRKFSEEEDEILKEIVSKLGPKNWRLVSSLIPGRSQRQCRDRYMNYLAPGFVRTQWTKEEDDLLAEKYKIYGSKWSLIRKFFPFRTSNDIKNRFNNTVSHKINLVTLDKTTNKININVESDQSNERVENVPFEILSNSDLNDGTEDELDFIFYS